MSQVTRRVARQLKIAVLRMNATRIGMVIMFGGVLLLFDILNRLARPD
jgi:hypothetical protein